MFSGLAQAGAQQPGSDDERASDTGIRVQSRARLTSNREALMLPHARIQIVNCQTTQIVPIDVRESVVHLRFAALEERLPEASLAAMIENARNARYCPPYERDEIQGREKRWPQTATMLPQ